MPSAVPSAITALAAAWQAQLTTDGVKITVGVGTPADLLKSVEADFIADEVQDWTQEWGVTPYQGATGLSGGIDEAFTLTCRIYRRRAGATLVQLLSDVDADRAALEKAVRADRTLGGVLSTSGMARVARAEQQGSLADDRTRELGLTVYVACRAWIAP